MRNQKGVTLIALIVTIIVLIIIGLIGSCSEESERNKVGSSIDWGPNHYWDSSTETVREKWW